MRMLPALIISSLLLGTPIVAAAQDDTATPVVNTAPLEETRDAPDPRNSATAGIGASSLFAPGTTSTLILAPAFSLRLWLEQLMVQPLLGFGVQVGEGTDLFMLTAGALVGYAIASTEHLRAIVGGGLTLGLSISRNDDISVAFGPMFALEYRFEELPDLSFDAALLVPFRLHFDPTVLNFGSEAGVLVGFHYYFSL